MLRLDDGLRGRLRHCWHPPAMPKRCRIVVEELDDARSAPAVPAKVVKTAKVAKVAKVAKAAAAAPAAPAAAAVDPAKGAARAKREEAARKKAEWEANKNTKGGAKAKKKAAGKGAGASAAQRARNALAKDAMNTVFPEDDIAATALLASELGLPEFDHSLMESMKLPLNFVKQLKSTKTSSIEVPELKKRKKKPTL